MNSIFKISLLLWVSTSLCLAQGPGAELFQKHCSSCHGMAEGSFGPKLGGVTQVRSKKEISDFIKSPRSFVKKKDERTLLLLEKYKSEMPGFPFLSQKKIDELIAYIENETAKQNIEPLRLSASNEVKRYAPPVKHSKLVLEVEDFVQLKRTPEHLDDKGTTTLRACSLGLFANDQMGPLYRISQNKAEVYLDLSKIFEDFIIFPSIGAGLGNFTFHPDFAENGLFYTSHLEKYRGKKAINEGDWPDSLQSDQQYVIMEWKANDPKAFPFAGTKREVMRVNNPTFAHSGQDLGFAPGLAKDHPDYGMLYYTFGDGGTANIKQPQWSHHKHSVLGSILRIDPQGHDGVVPSYGIPKDNPFANSDDPRVQKEIYAYGFRNPYRLCWDEGRNNALYVADIGEANVEELNVVQKGGDYGWADQEGSYGIDVRTDKTVIFEREDKGINHTILPVVTFDHTDGNATCGGYVYEGNLNPMKGKYFFGDIVRGRIFFTDPSHFEEGIFDVTLKKDGKITTVAELCGQKRTHMRIGYDHINGDLFILTKPDNAIRRITKAYYE